MNSKEWPIYQNKNWNLTLILISGLIGLILTFMLAILIGPLIGNDIIWGILTIILFIAYFYVFDVILCKHEIIGELSIANKELKINFENDFHVITLDHIKRIDIY